MSALLSCNKRQGDPRTTNPASFYSWKDLGMFRPTLCAVAATRSWDVRSNKGLYLSNRRWGKILSTRETKDGLVLTLCSLCARKKLIAFSKSCLTWRLSSANDRKWAMMVRLTRLGGCTCRNRYIRTWK
jgi:hypothetical protein